MEDLFTIIVFIAFSLISILGRARKAPPGTKPAPGLPGRHSPAPEGAAPRQEERVATGPSHGDGNAEQAAAVLIPDDLWEILTGEQRPSEPAPIPEEYDEWEPEPSDDGVPDWRSATEEELVLAGRPPIEEAQTLETIPSRELPRVVSLETPPLPPRERHEAFHRKIDALREAEASSRHSRRAPNRARLRQAIVLREVLGPPKGLEES